MKNIGTEVNKDIFVAFYKHLYGLLSTTMIKTQVFIIDTELSAPTIDLDYTECPMIAGDTEHPPLTLITADIRKHRVYVSAKRYL